MCIHPLFFEFISTQPFDLHTQDSIRVCGPFVVLLGMMAYRTRSLPEDARRAFSETCLVCYGMAVLLCLGGFQSGRWNMWLLVCAACFTLIGIFGHGSFALMLLPMGGGIAGMATRSKSCATA